MAGNLPARWGMLAVTPYRDCHFDAVSALWREAFPGDAPWNRPAVAIPRKLAFQPDLFFVATDADAVVGSVMAGYEGHRGWISRIAVLRSHRRRSVGRALIARAEAQLASLGCIEVDLQVVASNAEAAVFYARSGHAVEERVSMSKILGRPASEPADRPGRPLRPAMELGSANCASEAPSRRIAWPPADAALSDDRRGCGLRVRLRPSPRHEGPGGPPIPA